MFASCMDRTRGPNGLLGEKQDTDAAHIQLEFFGACPVPGRIWRPGKVSGCAGLGWGGGCVVRVCKDWLLVLVLPLLLCVSSDRSLAAPQRGLMVQTRSSCSERITLCLLPFFFCFIILFLWEVFYFWENTFNLFSYECVVFKLFDIPFHSILFLSNLCNFFLEDQTFLELSYGF